MLGLEWITNRALDVVLPPVGAFLLFFWAPVLAAVNFLGQVYCWLRYPSLKGKTVLITGASSGIGEQIAYQFARRNAKLVLAGQRAERLRAVGEQCERLGAWDYTIVEADVSKEIDCRRIVETAVSNFGRLDVLVNNAGIAHAFLFKDAKSIEALRRVMDVDFFGALWTTLHALPYLRRTGGSILVNASEAVFLTIPRHAVYSAAKAALLQLFETIRVEPAGLDVSITIAFPGLTASELTAGKAIEEHGRMVVDTDRRDMLLGPQPMMRTETVAWRMVNGVLARSRYVFVPFWNVMPLIFRVLAPELLFTGLRWQFMPWFAGGTPPHKLFMDTVGGAKMFYYPPTTSQEEADTAVFGQGKGARPEQGRSALDQGGGIVGTVVEKVKQFVGEPTQTERAVKAA